MRDRAIELEKQIKDGGAMRVTTKALTDKGSADHQQELVNIKKEHEKQLKDKQAKLE